MKPSKEQIAERNLKITVIFVLLLIGSIVIAAVTERLSRDKQKAKAQRDYYDARRN